jgi:hypothetical protein
VSGIALEKFTVYDPPDALTLLTLFEPIIVPFDAILAHALHAKTGASSPFGKSPMFLAKLIR